MCFSVFFLPLSIRECIYEFDLIMTGLNTAHNTHCGTA